MMALPQLPQFNGSQGGLFSRSWQQAPQQRFQGAQAPQQPSWLGQFMQQPMFQAADRRMMPLMSYLPLLLSRGFFGQNGQPPQAPANPQPIQAQPVAARTTSSAIAAQAARMAQQTPAPTLFTPTPQVTPQPAAAAPAAPAWSPASWFSDPNSAARRIAAQSWGSLPLQQQQQFYADTYMGGNGTGDGPAGNDFGLGFGIDTAAGIY